ncbi:MAG TPA: ATP-dependent dethiobiotin synthetase BioD [Desulfobacteraceae bacterium]|nr:ATP-dependent dethiobiotin synthetase BioD [Desulfobacteraceae bacterium]
MATICICGIDTGIGKSMVTGLLARFLHEQGKEVITQKPVQTGSEGQSEDILTHRRLMESGWLEEDERRLTCPYNFSFPGSPHLAAALAGKTISPDTITATTRTLEQKYEWVLVESAGGLMVPLTDKILFLDYLAQHHYPVVLVTSPRLGSINHTLMCLEMLRSRSLKLAGLVYNLHDKALREIVQDSQRFFSRALAGYGFADNLVVLPEWPAQRAVRWQKIIDSCS